MKKLICILLVCLFPVVAVADVDLSSMTYAQLLMLRNQLTEELMSRPEWKEVSVPGGFWVVGTDIPAGFYSIHPANNGAYLRIKDKNGSLVVTQGIRNESSSIGKIQLKDGYTVEIEGGTLIFMPSISLGF